MVTHVMKGRYSKRKVTWILCHLDLVLLKLCKVA